MTVYGWDASDYDWTRGPMQMGPAKAAGVDFFTHKISEGSSIVHAHCGEALARARDAGIELLGAYHVVRSKPSVAAQVDFMLAAIDRQAPWWRDWPGFFFQTDLEHWGYDDVPPEIGVAFTDEVHRRTGRWCVLYAPKWAYGNSIPGSDPLWASDYGSNPAVPLKQGYPGDASPRWAPYSGRVPIFLQYGSRLIIGTQPACDGNAYRGTLAELRALITGTTEGEDMHLVRSGASDATVCLATGAIAASGKYAALHITSAEILKSYEALGVKTVQLPTGVTIEGSALYDVNPAPWPGVGVAAHVHSFSIDLSETGTTDPSSPVASPGNG